MVRDLFPDSADVGHCWHAPAEIWLINGWKVFTPHGTSRPAEQYAPIGQASQSLALISPSLRPNLPAPQAVGAELPAAHQDDLGQGSGATVASVPHVKPAGQSPAHAALVCWLVSDPLPPSTPAAQAKG
eukprot:scaffold32981_cov66-Phaeocystis_antarctica.AAC.7